MDHTIFTLSNGIRLLFKPSASSISHACILVNAGSRDELPGKAGLAHFIEHMLFKRTNKRSTSQILNRLELVGADLNAFTTKEYTCVHASFLNAYLERTLDLFEDILFHSLFPEEEMEKEKGVITDEINAYSDQPEDAIHDDFDELLFPGHPLGKNILGDIPTVNGFNKTDITAFLREQYSPGGMVIGVTGNYAPEKLRKLCEKLFGHVQPSASTYRREPVSPQPPLTETRKKPVSQVHCVTGTRAYDAYHKNRIGLLLLNNLLGGNGMSAKLNLEIREKLGIAYTIESNYSPLGDTGIFSIYLGTDPEKIDRALKVMNRELRKLRENKMGSLQLQQAKQRFTGLIALGEENRMSLIIALSKSLLDYGKADTLEEVIEKIETIAAEQILEIANEILDPFTFTTLLFVPDHLTIQ